MNIHKTSVYARRISVTLLLSLLALVVNAQIKTMGTVKDETGEGMPGVSVIVKGTHQGVVTDLDGKFTISVESRNAVLQFSFLGYVTKEMKITPNRPMNVVLLEDRQSLDEVVVVGYQEVRKRDLTGAVSKADMKALTSTPVASFDQTLGGRIAGVNVTSNEGMPGSTMNIVIRGNNSLTQDNSPLYVIDGFPVESPSVAASINPYDIASVDILKDASATAIYGARGANGVVIITTKNGEVGQPKVEYDGSWGWQTVSKTIDLMDAYEFVKLQQEMYPAVTAERYLPLYEGHQWTLDDYKNIEQYNWQDMIFQSAPMQNHNVSLTGGSQGVRYNASMSLYDQDGVVIRSNYQKMQGRMGFTVTKKKLKLNLTTNYSRAKSWGASPSASSWSGMNNLFYSVYGYRPVTEPGVPLTKLLDNEIDESVNTSNDYRFNPIMSLNNEYNKRVASYIQFNGYAEYEFLKGLRLKVSGGYTESRNDNDTFNGSKTRYGGPTSQDGPNATVVRYKRNTWLNENTLTYQTNFKKRHYINALLGLSFQNSDYEYYSFKTIHIPNESLGMAGMDQGTPSTTLSAKTSWSMMSYFGRFNYNYRSKYYATFTMRADGSSKFRKGNRFGYFPSAAASWNFTEEDFMKSLRPVISNGKLRLSWGLTGNNRVGEYDSYGLYDMLKTKSDATTPGTAWTYNGETNIGVAPTGVDNKDLKWETTEQWDLGMDVAFLRERINLTVDLYTKTTRDLLLNATLVPSSGFSSAMKNIGKVRNQGIEVTLNTVNIKSKNFEWDTNFNIAFNKSKVLKLAENQTALLSTATFDQNYNSQPNYIAKVGYPMGMMYGYIYEGTYKYDDFNKSGDSYTLKSTVPYFSSENNTQPGMPKYRDINGDGVIDANDRTFIGRGLPIHTGGFTNNFYYKGFDLSVFLAWSYGNDVINANRLMFEGSGTLSRDLNMFASYANRWTPDNPTSDIPAAYSSGSYKVFSTRVIEDGSYLRLKTLSFGYTFPKTWMGKAGISQLRLYFAAQNLFTITGYDGYDPEVSVRHSALTPGLDYSSYPRARSYSFGVNLQF
jgi:TonB-linked SusC/RagA family outer membrane protein